MRLSQICEGLDLSGLDFRALSGEVSSVTSDSREICAGALFVAVRGGSQDGHAFISSAQGSGAVAVIGEQPKPAGCSLPYVQVRDSRLALARVAANFHGNPSLGMLLVGVTGTSGKTTTTYLIESVLQAAGRKVGLIGTVNFRYGSKVYPSTHTTPGPVELQRLVAEMRKEGCDAIVMEVSSHALRQHRAAFLAFDGMVFTNLSPEHLDFHPDMEDYFQAKALLFTDLADFAVRSGKKPFAAVNVEDAYGKRLLEDLQKARKADLRFGSYAVASGWKIGLDGIEGELDGVRVRSELTGRFNASNLSAAVCVARGMGISAEEVAQGIFALKVVPGRLEKVPNPQGIHVLVDYAHKSDALEKVLSTLRAIREGNRLIVVFGCGGDRDRLKRPVMGKLSVELADFVVVTSDNPRTEKPEAIIEEILRGMKGPNAAHFQVEADRKKAIFSAIRMAKPGDIVLIAGKGHEDYQIIADPSAPGKTRKIHFDDREVAAEALQNY